MFLHEFGEDFVLALELLLQEGDPPILGVAGSPGAGLEGGRGVLEELLLPAVEHGGVDAVPIAEVGDRGVFEEMEPQDGDLLLGREALSGLLGHGSSSARGCSLFEQAVCPISTEARQSGAAGFAGIPRTVFLTRLADFDVDTFRLIEEDLQQETRLGGWRMN